MQKISTCHEHIMYCGSSEIQVIVYNRSFQQGVVRTRSFQSQKCPDTVEYKFPLDTDGTRHK